MAFRFAHLADLHLAARPGRGEWTWRRGLGYANWVLRRRRLHPPHRLHEAVAALSEESFDAVLISGDIGQLGLTEEYAATRRALAPFTRRGIPVLLVGGNHDVYGQRPLPAWTSLCRDLRLDVPVDELGVARLPGAEVLLCDQARYGGWVGSWGRVPEGVTEGLARGWRPRTDGTAGGIIRLALAHYPLRTSRGRVLSRWMGLRGAESWPSLLDACGVRGYFCGHLHKRFRVDLTSMCRQYCAGSVTAGAGIDVYGVGEGGVLIPEGG